MITELSPKRPPNRYTDGYWNTLTAPLRSSGAITLGMQPYTLQCWPPLAGQRRQSGRVWYPYLCQSLAPTSKVQFVQGPSDESTLTRGDPTLHASSRPCVPLLPSSDRHQSNAITHPCVLIKNSAAIRRTEPQVSPRLGCSGLGVHKQGHSDSDSEGCEQLPQLQPLILTTHRDYDALI